MKNSLQIMDIDTRKNDAVLSLKVSISKGLRS